MKDNEEFYDQWLHALGVNKLYSTQFHSLLFPYDKLKDIKSSKLVNQVIFTFYMCESFGKDLNGIHKSYYDIGTSGAFKDHTDENWLIFNRSTYSSAVKNKVNFKTIRKRILEDVEYTKKYIEIRKKSFHHRLISLFKGGSVSKFEDEK